MDLLFDPDTTEEEITRPYPEERPDQELLWRLIDRVDDLERRLAVSRRAVAYLVARLRQFQSAFFRSRGIKPRA